MFAWRHHHWGATHAEVAATQPANDLVAASTRLYAGSDHGGLHPDKY